MKLSNTQKNFKNYRSLLKIFLLIPSRSKLSTSQSYVTDKCLHTVTSGKGEYIWRLDPNKAYRHGNISICLLKT